MALRALEQLLHWSRRGVVMLMRRATANSSGSTKPARCCSSLPQQSQMLALKHELFVRGLDLRLARDDHLAVALLSWAVHARAQCQVHTVMLRFRDAPHLAQQAQLCIAAIAHETKATLSSIFRCGPECRPPTARREARGASRHARHFRRRVLVLRPTRPSVFFLAQAELADVQVKLLENRVDPQAPPLSDPDERKNGADPSLEAQSLSNCDGRICRRQTGGRAHRNPHPSGCRNNNR